MKSCVMGQLFPVSKSLMLRETDSYEERMNACICPFLNVLIVYVVAQS